jgi:hypothetical protein
MPQFSVLPVDEAVKKADRSTMSDALAEYTEYLGSLSAGEAGRLTPSEGEDVRTVRMRLGAAARRMNKKVIIRRAGDEVLFWVEAA